MLRNLFHVQCNLRETKAADIAASLPVRVTSTPLLAERFYQRHASSTRSFGEFPVLSCTIFNKRGKIFSLQTLFFLTLFPLNNFFFSPAAWPATDEHQIT